MPAARSPFGSGAVVAMAHRGGALEAPENSWTSFRRVVSLGYRHIETDVRATRDGVVVVFHDADLRRVTDATGPVRGRTWAELAGVRNADGEPIMRLDEVLEEFPGVTLNIDVKCHDVVDPFLATVRRTRSADRLCVASFSGTRLARVRTRYGPTLATSASPAEIARVMAVGRGAPDRWARTPAVAVQVPELRRRLRVVDARFVQTAHRLGLEVHVWTVDDADAMARLLDLGVDGIITDRPTVLRDLLLPTGRWGG